jgi:hypothetical protein
MPVQHSHFGATPIPATARASGTVLPDRLQLVLFTGERMASGIPIPSDVIDLYNSEDFEWSDSLQATFTATSPELYVMIVADKAGENPMHLYIDEYALRQNWVSTLNCDPGNLDNALAEGRGYRWGFGGHEKDDEAKGNGNHISFGDYGYDTRNIVRWRTDPLKEKYPHLSPYCTFGNNPLIFIDSDGRDIELIIGQAYTDSKGKEHPYGHVALRVYNKELGYDFIYDFGRYGATSTGVYGILPDGSNPKGEGILHIYKSGDVYIKSEQNIRNSVGYSLFTSPEQDAKIIEYYNILAQEGEKRVQTPKQEAIRDRYKLQEDYWIKGPNCTTVSQDGLSQIGLDILGSEYDPREAFAIMENLFLKMGFKRTEYLQGGETNVTYEPNQGNPVGVGGGLFFSPD